MVVSRKIVVLAASKKLGSRCYAGKEISGITVGSWVRPVTSTDGSLNLTQMRLPDGDLPMCLDVVSVDLDDCCGVGHQTENWMLCSRSGVTRSYRFPSELVPMLRDTPDQLWYPGYSSSHGQNDRMPEDIGRRCGQSLYLVELEGFQIKVQNEFYGRKKSRGVFKYNGTEYALRITDTLVEESMKERDLGYYTYGAAYRVFGCISLALPYQGYCYKLLAAVHLVPKGN